MSSHFSSPYTWSVLSSAVRMPATLSTNGVLAMWKVPNTYDGFLRSLPEMLYSSWALAVRAQTSANRTIENTFFILFIAK